MKPGPLTRFVWLRRRTKKQPGVVDQNDALFVESFDGGQFVK